jgi:hypothetical protein
MSEQEPFIRNLQIAGIIALSIALIMTWGRIAFAWFKGGQGDDWYYPLVMSLQAFFILVQFWIIRLRRSAS